MKKKSASISKQKYASKKTTMLMLDLFFALNEKESKDYDLESFITLAGRADSGSTRKEKPRSRQIPGSTQV